MVRNFLIFGNNEIKGKSILINCDYPGQFISQIHQWLAKEILGIDETSDKIYEFTGEDWKKFKDCAEHVICCSFYLLESHSKDVWAEMINSKLKQYGLDYSVKLLRENW